MKIKKCDMWKHLSNINIRHISPSGTAGKSLMMATEFREQHTEKFHPINSSINNKNSFLSQERDICKGERKRRRNSFFFYSSLMVELTPYWSGPDSI